MNISDYLFQQPDLPNISTLLQLWYERNKRDLPWRNTRNPYYIWLSEVILQQTRVDQGLAYYNRFVARFPEIKDLAEADEDEVLKLWQGLGYYSRARNLHTTAKLIHSNFKDVFPSDYASILVLKGIGEYTAAAIASFAFDQPVATVDGNVYRVLSRIFGVDEPIDTGNGKKIFAALAQMVLDKNNPGLHNQAIMELGALQCVPVSPDCTICPFEYMCLAKKEGRVSQLPVKKGKTIVKNRYFNYLDIRLDDYMYLNKRVGNDIWKNLYELLLIETPEKTVFEKLALDPRFREILDTASIKMVEPVMEIKHVLSHRIIYATFYRIHIADDKVLQDRYIKIKVNDADSYAVSRLVHRYLEKIELL